MIQYRNKENWSLFSQWSNGVQHWWEGYGQLQRYNLYNVLCSEVPGTETQWSSLYRDIGLLVVQCALYSAWGSVESTSARYWVTGFLIDGRVIGSYKGTTCTVQCLTQVEVQWSSLLQVIGLLVYIQCTLLTTGVSLAERVIGGKLFCNINKPFILCTLDSVQCTSLGVQWSLSSIQYSIGGRVIGGGLFLHVVHRVIVGES